MDKNRVRQLAGLPTVRENYAMTNLATHQSPPATMSMGDEFRRIAGLPAIPSTSSGTPAVQPTQTHAAEPERSTVNPTPQASPAPTAAPGAEIVDEKDEDPTDNAEEKPAYPEAVMKAAKDAEGKTGDELVAVIQALYDQAVQDGTASCETAEEDTMEESVSVTDSKGKTIKAGDKITWTDRGGEHIGTVISDPKYTGGLRVGGRSIKNLSDESNSINVVK